jgi:cytochrome c2
MNPAAAFAAAFLLGSLAPAAGALELHPDRASPYDLAVRGLAGVHAEASPTYLRWSDLRALPTTRLTADGEFVPGPQVLTVVFLDDVWKALPVAPGADAVLARCDDGYTSLYTRPFISRYRPFLVLEINGKGPRDWPPPGLAFDPGPYVVTVSANLVPEASSFLDIEHKKPWAVTALEFVSLAQSERGFYSGKWASLTPAAAAGREIWINSCASCHPGPAGTVGGTKAHRPFEVIAAYAGYDRPFFMKYVRDPKSLVASAKMEAHPLYTDEQLTELAEFITAGQR